MTIKSKKILVVEDEAPIRQVLIDKLTHEGFIVSSAKDGEEGLQLALQEHPDLVLLDVAMPKMDGITVMKKLRQDSWGKKVPIILLTNLSATEEEIVRAIAENKPAYYLVKSDWKIEDVVKKVKEMLNT